MITLVKIWNTEKDELINIVKENEHIHFNLFKFKYVLIINKLTLKNFLC